MRIGMRTRKKLSVHYPSWYHGDCVVNSGWCVGWKYTHNYPAFNAHIYVIVQPNHDLRPL